MEGGKHTVHGLRGSGLGGSKRWGSVYGERQANFVWEFRKSICPLDFGQVYKGHARFKQCWIRTVMLAFTYVLERYKRSSQPQHAGSIHVQSQVATTKLRHFESSSVICWFHRNYVTAVRQKKARSAASLSMFLVTLSPRKTPHTTKPEALNTLKPLTHDSLVLPPRPSATRPTWAKLGRNLGVVMGAIEVTEGRADVCM